MSDREMVLKKEIPECNLTLYYRKDLNVLSIRWQLCGDSILRRRGYIEALNWAGQIHANYWILDLRGRGPGELNDDYWVLAVFFKLVYKVLNSTLYMAYLLVPSHYKKVLPRIPTEEVAKFKNVVEVKMFVNELDALEWLAKKQVLLDSGN